MTQHHVPEDLPTHLQHFIDGQWVDSIGGETFDVLDPERFSSRAGKIAAGYAKLAAARGATGGS